MIAVEFLYWVCVCVKLLLIELGGCQPLRLEQMDEALRKATSGFTISAVMNT